MIKCIGGSRDGQELPDNGENHLDVYEMPPVSLLSIDPAPPTHHQPFNSQRYRKEKWADSCYKWEYVWISSDITNDEASKIFKGRWLSGLVCGNAQLDVQCISGLICGMVIEMGRVIERLGYEITDGYVNYNERPSSFERAEILAGFRLDRRRNYAIFGDEVCELATWTQACSGCSGDEYCSHNAPGDGCDECGYTGLRKHSQWVPMVKRKTVATQR